MDPDQHPTRPTTPLLAAAVAAALLLAAAWTLTARSGDDPTAAGPPPPAPSAPPTTTPAAATTTTLDAEAEVIARLRHILRVRDQALETRNASLLDDVYTQDCPCLQGDTDAINRLRRSHQVWRGVSTSIRVQELERVNARLWIVNATFVAAPFVVENESGDRIRTTPGERNLTRFALAKPTGQQDWLLGHVSLVDQQG
jgi:hypothetical protein